MLRERASSPELTLASFGAVVDRSTGAPAPKVTRLVEILVHGEDIRRPLGIAHEYSAPAVRAALEYQAQTKLARGGGKERLVGLQLMANDQPVRLGTGLEVHGTSIALLLAVSGRSIAEHELTGAGAQALLKSAADSDSQ